MYFSKEYFVQNTVTYNYTYPQNIIEYTKYAECKILSCLKINGIYDFFANFCFHCNIKSDTNQDV